MTLRSEWLTTFVAVVDAGGFTRAGERLFRTQSAVSMQIRQLEEAIGAPVLVRHRSGVSPTATGERLLPSARRIAGALRQAELIADTPEAAAGPLRVGITEEYSGAELAALLAAFKDTQPRVTLEVRCDTGVRLQDSITAGDLDIALVLSDGEPTVGETILHDPTVWAMADDHEIPLREPLPLAVFDQACWWRTWATDLLTRAGRDWHIAYASPSVAGVAAAIRAGLGIGVLSRLTLPSGVREIPAEESLPQLPGSHLVLRVDHRDAPGVEVMAQLMREHFRH